MRDDCRIAVNRNKPMCIYFVHLSIAIQLPMAVELMKANFNFWPCSTRFLCQLCQTPSVRRPPEEGICSLADAYSYLQEMRHFFELRQQTTDIDFTSICKRETSLSKNILTKQTTIADFF